MTFEQLDIFSSANHRIASIKATEIAITRVKSKEENYYSECCEFALKFIKDKVEFTGEEIITAYKKERLPQPKNYRVFGAVVRQLKKLGFIEFKEFVKYQGAQGHGRPCHLWRVK